MRGEGIGLGSDVGKSVIGRAKKFPQVVGWNRCPEGRESV